MKHFCEQACRLASDSYERPLAWNERLKLNLHVFICKACRNYLDVLDTLHRTMNKLQQIEIGRYRLTQTQREKISRSLQEE